MTAAEQIRIYERSKSVVFLKTNDAFGGLSNMAGGFPLYVQGVRILTAEALYQACRFPHLPEVQRLIIGQNSPMTAKMKSKPYRKDSRPDWDRVRTKIMRWCLRVKLAQNWANFSELLLETGDRPIVEESRKDDFWGAKPVEDGALIGMNVLGRLLMELRESVKTQGRASLLMVEPLAIPDFCLFGKPIDEIFGLEVASDRSAGVRGNDMASSYQDRQSKIQPSLFETPTVKEVAPVDYSRNGADGFSIAGLKPYSVTRDTEVSWLGTAPSHWQQLPGRACFREKKTPNRGLQEKSVLSLSYGRIVIKPPEKLHGLVPESFETYQIVDPRDIVIRPTDLQNDWNSLRFGFARNRGIITSAYLCFRAKEKLLPEYAHLLLHTYDLMKVFYGLGSGLRQNLDWSDFKYLPCLVPPREEQAAIVRFLEWANGRLERAIRVKQKVIALLNEQKRAIIHRAVTRGLDPSGPLKPSGDPWLGDIPQHWEVRPIKRWAKINARTLGQSTEPDYKLRYIDIGSVATGRLVRGPESMYFRTAPSRARRILIAGDTIVSTVRTYLKAVWFVGYEAENLIASTGFAVFSPNPELEPEYLHYVLQDANFVDQVSANSIGIAYPAIAETVLARFRIAIPPTLAEQRDLILVIKSQTEPLVTTISRLERELWLLNEYRTRLVADVVTGKFDVREASQNFPEEVTSMDESNTDAEEFDAAESVEATDESEA